MDANANPASETITSSSILVSGESSNVQEEEKVKDPETSAYTSTSKGSSENSLVSKESRVDDGNAVVSETSDSGKSNSEPSTGIEATTSQTNEGKETEEGRKSPGAVADTIKAFENKIKSFEEIEMATFQNPSQGSQPPVGDGKGAAISRDISHLEKDKISSSTPCLLPSSKVTGAEEKVAVIQKATSSPVLPVIKITQVDDVKGEVVIQESPAESNAETGEEPAQKISDTSVDASAQSISKDEAVQQTTAASDNTVSSAECSEEQTAKISDPSISPAEGSEEQTAKASDPSISPADSSEEQTSKASDPSISPTEGSEEQTANASVQTISPAANGAPKDVPEDAERKAFFYISSSEISSRKRDESSSETSSLFSQENLDESRCLGPTFLHVGILICSVFVAFVSLSFYKLAHEGKMEKVYETAALCVAAIALVVGVFSTLYITFLMCFPVIPDVQYERIGGIGTATAARTLPRTPENRGVANTSLQIRKREPNSRPAVEQDSSSTDLDSAEKLKTEITGLLETFSDVMSKHTVERSTEELFFVVDEMQKDPSSETTASQGANSSPPKMAAESSNGSDSSGTISPSKKND